MSSLAARQIRPRVPPSSAAPSPVAAAAAQAIRSLRTPRAAPPRSHSMLSNPNHSIRAKCGLRRRQHSVRVVVNAIQSWGYTSARKCGDAHSSRRGPGCGGARFTWFFIGDVGMRRRASLLQSVVASGRLNRAVLRRSRGELALVAVVRRRRCLLVVIPRKGWRKLAGRSLKNTYQQSQRYDWAWYTTGQVRLGHRPSALAGYQVRSVSRDSQRISMLCKAISIFGFSPHTQVHGQWPVTASRVLGHVRSCGVC